MLKLIPEEIITLLQNHMGSCFYIHLFIYYYCVYSNVVLVLFCIDMRNI